MPFNAQSIYPNENPSFVSFPSRRSVVHSTNGMVACTQPLAAEAGQRILKMGGNAAVGFKPSLWSLERLLTEYRTPQSPSVSPRYTASPPPSTYDLTASHSRRPERY